MVKVIMGLKGSGKTKQLIDLVTKAVNEESGDVIVIEKEAKMTYDITYRARLIFANQYDICGDYEFFKGFLSGLHAGNYDVTHIFIDSLGKIVDDISNEKLESFLAWVDAFGKKEDVDFTITISRENETVSEDIKKYF